MLERIWRENYPFFRALARSIAYREEDIEDILQESYLRLLKSASLPTEKGPILSFMRKVVWSASIDSYRRRRRDFRLRARVAGSAQEPPNPLSELLQADRERARNELLHQLCDVLGELPKNHRQALRLYFGREVRTITQACSQSGLPYSTLRSRMLVAIKELRKLLSLKDAYRICLEHEGRSGNS